MYSEKLWVEMSIGSNLALDFKLEKNRKSRMPFKNEQNV